MDNTKAKLMVSRIAGDYKREYSIQDLEELIVFIVAQSQLTNNPFFKQGTQQKNNALKVAPIWKDVIGTIMVEKRGKHE